MESQLESQKLLFGQRGAGPRPISPAEQHTQRLAAMSDRDLLELARDLPAAYPCFFDAIDEGLNTATVALLELNSILEYGEIGGPIHHLAVGHDDQWYYLQVSWPDHEVQSIASCTIDQGLARINAQQGLFLLRPVTRVDLGEHMETLWDEAFADDEYE